MRLLICLLILCSATLGNAQDSPKEKAVKAYYTGFEKKDWNLLGPLFASDFTFTSPNNDDHISLSQFKQKCWPTAKFVKKVDYIKMMEKTNDLVLLVQITTNDNNIVRNTDLFSFNSAGKIKSIEVFFGAGKKYPGNK